MKINKVTEKYGCQYEIVDTQTLCNFIEEISILDKVVDIHRERENRLFNGQSTIAISGYHRDCNFRYTHTAISDDFISSKLMALINNYLSLSLYFSLKEQK